jgi:hypothetical protein
LLAISRCFAGSIAAKPRFEPPLLVAAIARLLFEWRLENAVPAMRFIALIKISAQPLKARSMFLTGDKLGPLKDLNARKWLRRRPNILASRTARYAQVRFRSACTGSATGP